MDQRKQFQETFANLHTLSRTDKIQFLEYLLFYFTITGRGIWSDDQLPDAEKIEAFKWLNELTHRVWNIQFDLQREEDDDSIVRLHDNMKFYSEQSRTLGSHLVPTTILAFESFEKKRSDRKD